MRARRHERGATLVEGALAFLLLFTLLMGIFEFGRAYNIFQALTNSAREGSRHSIAPFSASSILPDAAAVENEVRRFLRSAGVQEAEILVDQSERYTVNGVENVYTQVVVTAPYRFLFFPFGSVNMSTRVVMRNETN